MQGGQLMDTIVGMLAAGSENEFMMTEQGQGMLGNSLDIEMLKYVANDLLPTMQNGTLAESNAILAETLAPFVASQIEAGRELKTQVAGDVGMQTNLGQLIVLQGQIENMNAGIQSVGDAAKVAGLSQEKDRKGIQLHEYANNFKMDAFVQNMADTVREQMESALADAEFTITSENLSAITSNVGSFWSQFWTDMNTEITSGMTNIVNAPGNFWALMTGQDYSRAQGNVDDEVIAAIMDQFSNVGGTNAEKRKGYEEHLEQRTKELDASRKRMEEKHSPEDLKLMKTEDPSGFNALMAKNIELTKSIALLTKILAHLDGK